MIRSNTAAYLAYASFLAFPLLALAQETKIQPPIETKVPPGQVTLQPIQPTQPGQPVQTDLSKAALKFETVEHDFGKIGDESPVQYSYKFVNNSDRTITIGNVGVSCGCTSAPLAKKTYGPGETGTIDVTFNPRGRRGKEIKHVNVTTDDPATNSIPIQLSFSVDVRARVMLEPVTVTLSEVRKGKAATQNFTIIGRAENFDVLSVTPRDAKFKVERLDKSQIELDGDKLTRIGYQVSLPDNVEISTLRTVLDIQTNDTQKQSIQMPLSADVVGDLRILPDRLPVMFRAAGEPWFREIRVDHRRDEEFSIVGIESDAPAEMQVVLDIEREQNKAATKQPWFYRVRISGVAPTKPGAINAKIIIKTNSKDQEEIIVPIQGNLAASANQ